MSHVAVYKTEITNADRALLEVAFQAVAEAVGGTVCQVVADYIGGNEQAVDVALKTAVLRNGIGAKVNGELQFVGDPWAVEGEWNRIKQLILSNYTALGYIDVVKEAGLSDVTMEETADEIVINAFE